MEKKWINLDSQNHMSYFRVDYQSKQQHRFQIEKGNPAEIWTLHQRP